MANPDLITAVILDDHPAIVAGVRAWCADAEPPIELIDASDQVGRLWTEPGRSADVVVFDLQLGVHPPLFRELERLEDAGRQVVVYSQRVDAATARTCIRLGAFTYLTKAEGQHHLVPAISAAAHDLPYTPPAQRLGCSEGAARVRVARGLSQLVDELEAQ